MDLSKLRIIYLVGIKGVGMTMLAQYLVGRGVIVVGSDTSEVFMTDEVLRRCGIKVIEGFDAKNIPSNVDLIVYSIAYNAQNNVEVAAAMAGKIKVMKLAQAIAEIFNQKYGIAVAGSHGKTTTTACLGYVMQKAGLDPSVMTGANVPQFEGCSLVGGSEYLILEADEYDNKLANYQPKMVLLNNIDYDHPDFFQSETDYKNVFIDFIKKIPVKGLLVANNDDPIIRKIAQVNCHGKVVTYAIDETADYVAYDLCAHNGKQYFKVKFGVEEEENSQFSISGGINFPTRYDELGDFTIQLAGKHNVSNVLAVIAAGIELNIDLFKIRKYLEEFNGTTRRMQVLGEFHGATIIDDYAHHPTEIKATIQALKQKYGTRKLIVIFHPHTFTRTRALFDDFVKCFEGVDQLIVLDIYGSAREKQGGVSSRELVEAIKQENKKTNEVVKYIPTLIECEKYLREQIERDDLVVLMGAGDVFRIGESLLKQDLEIGCC